jgi:L-alanine-DL-glutamate epimerase-like enolase superfamily enzyme
MSRTPLYRTEIVNASVEFRHQPFGKPLQISRGVIIEITEARASVAVRVDGGTVTVGRGSIYLSDLWAWPDPALNHEQRDAAMRACCEHLAKNLRDWCGGEAEHPMELGLRLHHKLTHAETSEISQITGGHAPPPLARAVCASPFDAALHDAAGRALGVSAFKLYGPGVALPSADAYFEDGSASEAIARMVRPSPRRALDAWLLVGAKDSLEADVAPWVRGRGYRCFKLKLLGTDNAADVARTVEVYRAAQEMGVPAVLSVDTNEANPDAESVLDYLMRLHEAHSGAFQALQYLEQPTPRDVTRHAHDWRKVVEWKPVLLDEGLTDLDGLALAAEQGWGGIAAKTCKGHSFMLAAAAWAHERRMVMTMQDLTNPGIAAVHSYLFAAYVPTDNGVELNSPQFTPAANADWLPRLAGLLDPHDGTHRLEAALDLVGLGSDA